MPPLFVFSTVSVNCSVPFLRGTESITSDQRKDLLATASIEIAAGKPAAEFVAGLMLAYAVTIENPITTFVALLTILLKSVLLTSIIRHFTCIFTDF